MPNYQNCNKVTYKPAGASNKMLSGTTAHDKSGAVVTGSIQTYTGAVQVVT